MTKFTGSCGFCHIYDILNGKLQCLRSCVTSITLKNKGRFSPSSKVYLEPCLAYMMESFAKIVNSRTRYLFLQKFMSQMFDRVLNTHLCLTFRSSRPEVFRKNGVLKNFTKATGKRLCQSLFFNIVAALRPATLLKKRLRQRCFPVNFAKF